MILLLIMKWSDLNLTNRKIILNFNETNWEVKKTKILKFNQILKIFFTFVQIKSCFLKQIRFYFWTL